SPADVNDNGGLSFRIELTEKPRIAPDHTLQSFERWRTARRAWAAKKSLQSPLARAVELELKRLRLAILTDNHAGFFECGRQRHIRAAHEGEIDAESRLVR